MIEVVLASPAASSHSTANYRDSDALVDIVLPEDGEYLVRLFEFTYLSGSADHGYRLTISTAPWIDAVYPPAIEFGKPTPVTLLRPQPAGRARPAGFSIDGRPLEKKRRSPSRRRPIRWAATRLHLTRSHRAETPRCKTAFEYSIKGPGGTSNGVPIYYTREKSRAQERTRGSTKPENRGWL